MQERFFKSITDATQENKLVNNTSFIRSEKNDYQDKVQCYGMAFRDSQSVKTHLIQHSVQFIHQNGFCSFEVRNYVIDDQYCLEIIFKDLRDQKIIDEQTCQIIGDVYDKLFNSTYGSVGYNDEDETYLPVFYTKFVSQYKNMINIIIDGFELKDSAIDTELHQLLGLSNSNEIINESNYSL